VIYERLADNQLYRDITFQHLADFASLGNCPPHHFCMHMLAYGHDVGILSVYVLI